MRRLVFVLLLLACGEDRSDPAPCHGTCSDIHHLVVIIQENHSFDTYFGDFCQAEPGSNPTCTAGPACCERMPDLDPGTGAFATTLNDHENGAYSPDHSQPCELLEIDGGKMDHFTDAPGCGSTHNFALVDASLIQPYRDWAQTYALADRWFQPLAGASAANDMYFARAQFVFTDNDFVPDAIGATCSFIQQPRTLPDTTIGDLLSAAGVEWAFYAEGYHAMAQAVAMGGCPSAPPDCPFGVAAYPCIYDPSDVPFEYYMKLRDDPVHMRDFGDFARDLAAGKLPAVTFIKAIGYRTEHPSLGVTISAGVEFSKGVVDAILGSPAAKDTLIVFTYDESGGYFDHVAPPPASAVDGKPYGARVPTIAIGRFARKGTISHVQLEHSSLVRFIEWNWLARKTGQLGGRDAVVANIGSLLDPALGVPER